MPIEPRLPSLIDRLASEPDGQAVCGDGLSDEELKRTVLRDLSWLLNTTRLEAVTSLEQFPEVRESVLNYGLDTLAGRCASEVDENEVAASVARAISIFEPRLRAVQVVASKKTDSIRDSVVLTIDAQLLVRPLREIEIRGVLDLDNSEISLESLPRGS